MSMDVCNGKSEKERVERNVLLYPKMEQGQGLPYFFSSRRAVESMADLECNLSKGRVTVLTVHG